MLKISPVHGLVLCVCNVKRNISRIHSPVLSIGSLVLDISRTHGPVLCVILCIKSSCSRVDSSVVAVGNTHSTVTVFGLILAIP